jgi:hypothetical protein
MTCVNPSCAAVATPWAPAGFVAVDAADVSASAALAVVGVALTVLVENLGPSVAYVALGTSTVVATTSSTPVQPGDALAVPQGTATYAASITASGGAATVNFTSGAGSPNVVNGQVTANDAAVVDVLTATGTFVSGVFAALTGTSSALFAAASPARRLRVRVMNLDIHTESGGGGGAVWLAWGTTAAVRGPSSFLLVAGASFNDTQYPNQLGLNVIAEDGSAPFVYWETY